MSVKWIPLVAVPLVACAPPPEPDAPRSVYDLAEGLGYTADTMRIAMHYAQLRGIANTNELLAQANESLSAAEARTAGGDTIRALTWLVDTLTVLRNSALHALDPEMVELDRAIDSLLRASEY
jgi:hypothetical protein